MRANGQHRTIGLAQRVVIILLVVVSDARDKGFCQTASDSINVLIEATKLIEMPEPFFGPFKPQPMDSVQLAELGIEQVFKSDPVMFLMRDGKALHAEKFAKESNTTIIVLHGVLTNSSTYNRMSGLLREAVDAEVFAVDLRGHGQSEGIAGDVDYVDQYADDVADIVSKIKDDAPNERIILAGHSMGGGIALRFAMNDAAPKVDGYLLFAPLLGHNAPTLRKASVDEAGSGEPFMKIHLSRIIGILTLNSIGVHTYDSLPVLFFNLPKEMPLNKYSYRSNLSMAPDDYREGLKAVNKPLLVIVGSRDEAFVASEYDPVVTTYSEGEVVIIDGATHNGVRHCPQTMEAVKNWLRTVH